MARGFSLIHNKGAGHLVPFLVFVAVLSIFLTGCIDLDPEDEDDMVPENWMERSYSGSLSVQYTNVYPEWDISTSMDVMIDKELGLITFEQGTLDYSGETMVSDDSKIERSGSWIINPTGYFEGDRSNPIVKVDAGITVNNDVQRIYALDDSGEWQLVSEVPFSVTPNSNLAFDFNDTLTGDVISVTTEGGSITWILTLTPHLD